MSDDLNLLIIFLSTSDELTKVAIKVEHGMNIAGWEDWEYFREPEIEKLLRDAMPVHVESFCKRILAVEDLFDIKG